jgi:hypothetical protein
MTIGRPVRRLGDFLWGERAVLTRNSPSMRYVEDPIDGSRPALR